jgi:chitosanase
LTIEQITSIFENGTSQFQYSYIEDIGDGAGPTCGRIGFTGGEIGLLVGKYEAKKGPSPLAQYLPCLQKMGDRIEQNYTCLFPSVSAETFASQYFKSKGITQVDFGEAWARSGSDPVMQKIQDDYVLKTYFNPALQEVSAMGLHTPLAAALFYDTVVQMDSIQQIEIYARNQFSAKHLGRVIPETDSEENEWLGYYQTERNAILMNTPTGAGTAPRVRSLNQILKSGNMNLNLPIHFTYFRGSFILDGSKLNAK